MDGVFIKDPAAGEDLQAMVPGRCFPLPAKGRFLPPFPAAISCHHFLPMTANRCRIASFRFVEEVECALQLKNHIIVVNAGPYRKFFEYSRVVDVGRASVMNVKSDFLPLSI